jgi:hypothetical protein
MTAGDPGALRPRPITFRRSRADRLGILLIALLLLAMCFLPLLAALQVLADSPPFALFLGAIGLVMVALTLLVLTEVRARWITRIVLDGNEVTLRLPARRGYVRRAAVDRRLPLTGIRGVETRGEAFRAAGSTVLQQSFALRLDDGEYLELGGDRAWMAPLFGEAALAIAERAELPLVDRGMVDGRPGFLMLWGQSVPPWDAPALAPAEAERRISQVRRAWQLLTVVLLVLVLLRLLAAFL